MKLEKHQRWVNVPSEVAAARTPRQHDHPDPDQLVTACPECCRMADSDLLDELVDTATLYRVSVTATHREKGYQYELAPILGWPRDWTTKHMAAYYLKPEIHPLIRVVLHTATDDLRHQDYRLGEFERLRRVPRPRLKRSSDELPSPMFDLPKDPKRKKT